MSEGRQLSLLLVGLLVLGALGFGGAALWPAPCDDLERRGDLVLEYRDVAEALPVAPDVGQAVAALGGEAGLGEFRGAVAVPQDARLLPAEAEFFLVTDDQFVVLRPGFGVASNARARDSEQVVAAHRAIGLVAEDGTTVLYDGELDVLRCGQLVEPARVLDVDRGVSIVRDDGATSAVTLSGEVLWSLDLGAPPLWAWVVERTVLVGTDDGVVEVALPDGALVAAVTDTATTRLDARGDRVLAEDRDGDPVLLAAGSSGTEPVDAEQGLLALVPGGLVEVGVAGDELVARAGDEDGAGVTVPGLALLQLVTADDGMVAALVELEGERAVLQWGPVQLG